MKLLIRIARLSFVVLIVYFFVNHIDYNALIDDFSLELLIAMMVSQIMTLLAVFFMSARLSIFVHKVKATYVYSFKAIFLSMGFNIIVPGRLSEFVKPIYLKSKAGIKIENGLSSVFLERVSDLFILSSLAGIVLFNTFLKTDLKIFIIIPLFIFLFLFYLPKYYQYLENVIEKIRVKKIVCLLKNILQHLNDSIKDKSLIKGFFIGLLGWACSIFSIILFFIIAEEGNISVFQCLIIFVVSTFAYAIPTLPAGFGTYEASIVFVLKSFGYGLERSVLLALSLHAAQICLIGLVASLILIKEDLNIIDIVKKYRLQNANNEN